MVRWLASLVLAISMAACSSTPQQVMTQPLLHDEFFTAPAQPIDARDVFALDDAMRSYLRDNGKGALFFHNRASGWCRRCTSAAN